MMPLQCPKCSNEMRTTSLVTPQGEVLIAGTLSAEPQPVLAYVCSACGYVELYAPRPTGQSEAAAESAPIPSEADLLGDALPAG